MNSKIKLLGLLLGTASFASLLTSCMVDARRPAATTTSVEAVHSPGYVVSTLPSSYTTVTRSGSNYYVADGVYYRPSDRGYVVVSNPL